MKLSWFSSLVLVCLSLASFSQSRYTITGTIRGLGQKKVFLGSYYGEKISPVDSSITDASGNLTFNLKPGMIVGLYRLSWSKDQFVDLILNNENVDFTTTAEEPGDSIRINSSKENSLFFWFLKLEAGNQSRLQLLIPLVDYYPSKDPFYREITTQFESIQRNQQRIIDSLVRSSPSSYAVRIIKLQQAPYLPASLTRDERLTYLKAHFFDNADFHDTLLLRSNIWPNKTVAYLGLYGNNRLSQKQLEAEFIKAVTAMLSVASVDPDVYKFLLDYLISGFDKYHFDGVITYMADHFQDPFSCEDQARKSALQKKLDTFKKISLGKTAPDIEVPDTKGKMIRLSDIKSEYTLLIFWSTECGHCVEMMPKVRDLYNKQKPKRYEILAVSLDKDAKEWTKYIQEEKLNWLNGCELKGFDSQATDAYNIYATPTMFLLDREKKIIAKPISYRELDQDLKDNKLQ